MTERRTLARVQTEVPLDPYKCEEIRTLLNVDVLEVIVSDWVEDKSDD